MEKKTTMIGFRSLLVLSAMVVSVAFSLVASAHLKADSVIQQLTTDPATDVRPIWSPDGQQIAYQSNRNGNFSIWLMDANGENQREITPGDSDDRHPAWSPDGQRLAFDSDASGSREIWVIDQDGQNLQQVTSIGQISNFPGWSPDGTMLSFYVYQAGTLNLWTVLLGGDDPRPLTSDLADERRNQCTFACHQAGWSPDGQRLAYTGGDQRSIWTINVDGSNPTEIVSGEDSNNHFPWYTADGQVGYLTEHITADVSWTDAWLLNPASGEVTLLLDRIRHQGPLEWSPDGTKVLFHSPRSGNFDLYVVDLSAEGGAEVLQGEGEQLPPSSFSESGHPDEIAKESEVVEAEAEVPETADVEAAEPESSTAPEPVSQTSSNTSLVIWGGVGLLVVVVAVSFMILKRRKPHV
jgi:Tol biopolymer transport system component